MGGTNTQEQRLVAALSRFLQREFPQLEFELTANSEVAGSGSRTPDAVRIAVSGLVPAHPSPPEPPPVPPSNGHALIRSGEVWLFTALDTIVFARASGSYCQVFFTDRSPVLLSKNLKALEQELNAACFFRIHHSLLVNVAHVREYVPKGGYCKLSNGEELAISVRKREAFLERLRLFC
ncbi:MAG: LytTR family DNA-binding domain-containing protein [Bacteroidota bacterium]